MYHKGKSGGKKDVSYHIGSKKKSMEVLKMEMKVGPMIMG